MPATVYHIKDPTTHAIRYVGCTRQSIEERLAAHCALARSPSARQIPGLYAWLRELGSCKLRPIIEAIEIYEVEAEGWEGEKAHIQRYQQAGVDLFNTADGGRGPNGVTRSERTRKLMGDAKRGVPKTADHRLALSRSLGGKPFRDDKGRTYQSIHEAGQKLGIQYQNIWKVLQGRRPTAGGRKFFYIESTV